MTIRSAHAFVALMSIVVVSLAIVLLSPHSVLGNTIVDRCNEEFPYEGARPDDHVRCTGLGLIDLNLNLLEDKVKPKIDRLTLVPGEMNYLKSEFKRITTDLPEIREQLEDDSFTGKPMRQLVATINTHYNVNLFATQVNAANMVNHIRLITAAYEKFANAYENRLDELEDQGIDVDEIRALIAPLRAEIATVRAEADSELQEIMAMRPDKGDRALRDAILETRFAVHAALKELVINTRAMYTEHVKPMRESLAELEENQGNEFNPTNHRFGPRLSVVHVGPAYPDRLAEGDMLTYGIDLAKDLGFQSVEVFMDPRICQGSYKPNLPRGLYQTNEYCDSKNPRRMGVTDLRALAEKPQFAQIFADPNIKRYLITLDALNPAAANQKKISDQEPWTAEELQLMYGEVKRLTKYLLDKYQGTGKTFIFSSPSEMDWHLTGVGADRGGCERGEEKCNDIASNKDAVKKTITYINRVNDAINDGIAEFKDRKGVTIKQACEINFLVRATDKSLNRSGDTVLEIDHDIGLTSVIPHTKCDYVAWSAHEAWRDVMDQIETNKEIEAAGKKATDPNYYPEPEDVIVAGLDLIAKYPPLSHDPSSGKFKNVIIGEIGFKENHDAKYLDNFITVLEKTLDWGVYQLNLWALLDNECDSFNPTKAQSRSVCKGFWLLRPAETLNQLEPGLLLPKLYREISGADTK